MTTLQELSSKLSPRAERMTVCYQERQNSKNPFKYAAPFHFSFAKSPVTGSAPLIQWDWMGWPVRDTKSLQELALCTLSLFQEDASRLRIFFSGFRSPVRANPLLGMPWRVSSPLPSWQMAWRAPFFVLLQLDRFSEPPSAYHIFLLFSQLIHFPPSVPTDGLWLWPHWPGGPSSLQFSAASMSLSGITPELLGIVPCLTAHTFFACPFLDSPVNHLPAKK